MNHIELGCVDDSDIIYVGSRASLIEAFLCAAEDSSDTDLDDYAELLDMYAQELLSESAETAF